MTSKKILQRGQLQRRVTLIPINKIQSGSLQRQVVEYAQNKVGAENVQWAMSLVSYDRYYEPVMKYLFGGTLICRDLDIAKQVSYDPRINCRSVTLEGDVVDPHGTVSGGAPPKGANVLEELYSIRQLEKEYKQIDAEIAAVEQQMA